MTRANKTAPALVTTAADAPVVLNWAQKVAAMQLAEDEAELAALEAATNPVAPAPVETAKAPAAQAKPATAPATPLVAIEMPRVEGDLAAMIAAISRKDADLMSANMLAEFDARIAYEAAKPEMTAQKAKNLAGYRSKLGSLSTAALFVAIDFDTAFVNRSIVEGKRTNVYALDKLADLAASLNSGVFKNAVTNAVTRSLFKFRKAGVPFTGLMARAAASDRIKVEAALAAILVRHTVEPTSTANSQSSSSLDALKALGVVVNTGNRSNPVWVLTDTPQTRRLEAMAA